MTACEEVIVLGAGGHAKVVISTLIRARYKVVSVYDDDPGTWGETCLGIPIVGGISSLSLQNQQCAVIAVGHNPTRRSIANRFPDFQWVTVVHPNADVHPSVQLAEGVVVFSGAVIQPDTRIGAHTIINTGATVDHDCLIDRYVHLAPGVHLAGNVRVGEGSFLGIGSSAIPGVNIGVWSTIGAGGVVIDNIPDHVIAVGVPAKILMENK